MKPSIHKLFEAFNDYSIKSRRAGNSREKWEKAYYEFRSKLEVLGIARVFDWNYKSVDEPARESAD